MKQFKFLTKNEVLFEADLEIISRQIQRVVRSREHIPAGYIPLQRTEELYMEVEDVDTGECFGIPAAMSYAISYRGKMLYENSRTVSGRCDYGSFEYWIDNVYRTIEHTLVVEVTISLPYNHLIRNRTRHTFHKIRQIIPYETV